MLPLLRSLCTLAAIALLLVPATHAQDAASSDMPPLIDRQVFFGDPEIAGAQVSPDGRHVTFIKPYRGVMNIWVKDVDAPFDDARPITADTTRPVTSYFWSQDSENVLYVQDKGGNENFHVYVVDPAAEAEPATGVPPARDVTPYEDTRAFIYAVPENTPKEIVVGLNDRDAAWHDAYRVDLETGERELLWQNEHNLSGYTFDREGQLRLADRTTEDGSTEILRVDGEELTPVYTCTVEETCYAMRFQPDGERVYLVSNVGERDLTALFLFDPETQEAELVESDPENQVDFGGAEFSDVTDELVATYYRGDRLRIYTKDEQFAAMLEDVRGAVPDGEISFGASTEDEQLHIIRVSSDVDPGSTYLFDRDTGQAGLLYRSRPELPSEHLADMQAIRYEARDGTPIPAYLTLPKGVEPTNLPTVVMPHGGPWARDYWGYDSFAQFLANRGYAVLQPNFRGSTGYGQAFLNAGNREWGEAMQDDLSDGVRYLIDQGIADPDRVGIMGGSYGGYATLAGVTFTPELYAAGISIVGPSNLITLLNSIPPYWASARRVFNVRVGDPDVPEDAERLRAQSPFFHANRIDDPLLVIQGANDPRVKQAESDQIVVAARENDTDVQYLVAPDEGHGFRGRENRLAMIAKIEDFLADHLGGRYQEDMAADVRNKLSTITVDPATVTLPEEPKGADEAATAPLPKLDGSLLEPMTMNYSSTVEMNGRKMESTVTRTIEAANYDGTDVWRIVDRAETPVGSAADTFLVDRTTLAPLARRSTMGDMNISLDYGEEAVTGEMRRGGQAMPLQANLEAPVLSDGGALELSLAALPLEEGYETTFRIYSLQAQSVRPMRLAVTGTDSFQLDGVTVPTYTVQLQPLDDSETGTATLHVTQEAPHYVVRNESKLPAQMGGGTSMMTLESMQTGSGSQ